ncbi:hypothetical protein BHG03_25965 [Klebsiella pneumoniae]|nr:hypothetical protein BHG03_25965 [Klebsiella pneumoniae]
MVTVRIGNEAIIRMLAHRDAQENTGILNMVMPGFHSARIVALTAQQVHLRFTASFSVQLADFTLQINHLIKDDFVITCTCPPREA